jgi:hypothetical protein
MKKYVIFLESFEIEYLQKVKDFIKTVAPYIYSGIFTEPLSNWERILSKYPYNTVEWYNDSDMHFLYYGHGIENRYDTVLTVGQIPLGEL